MMMSSSGPFSQPSDKLDLSLDAIVRANKTAKAGMTAPAAAKKPRHFHKNKPFFGRNKNNGNNGAKLRVSNLDPGVSERDLRQLFGSYGRIGFVTLQRLRDAHGRTRGTADIGFADKSAAERAVQDLDNREFDGKPMRITYVTGNNNSSSNNNNSSKLTLKGVGQKSKAVFKNKDSLDKDLDAYMKLKNKKSRFSKAAPDKSKLDTELDTYMEAVKVTNNNKVIDDEEEETPMQIVE